MKSFSIKSSRTFSEKPPTDKYKKVRSTPYWKEAERLVKIKSPEISQEDCDLIVGFGLDLAADPKHFIDALKEDLKSSGKKFSESKNFSKITTEDEFREYAHKVMKEAHGDKYSEEVTNKVVDDLIKNNPDADYGELIGRLTSGFGDKSFADAETEDIVRKSRTFSISEVKTKDGLTPKQVVSANKSQCDKLVKRFYNEYKSNNAGVALKDLDECYDECKHDFVRIDSKVAKWNDLLLELASRMVAIEMVDKNATRSHSRTFSGGSSISDRTNSTRINEIVGNSRTFSIAEDREFAHGRGYKSRQLEVRRLQDLYNDVKSKQKGDDPSQKLRNRMLLQEIKVRLEEARYEFYKHAFEESRS